MDAMDNKSEDERKTIDEDANGSGKDGEDDTERLRS